MPVQSCQSCGSEHLPPVPCGMTFVERLRSVQVHGSVLESRSASRRFDTESVDDQFGGTAKERKDEFYADTRGLGNIKHVEGGALYKDRKTGNVEKISDAKLEKEFSVPK